MANPPATRLPPDEEAKIIGELPELVIQAKAKFPGAEITDIRDTIDWKRGDELPIVPLTAIDDDGPRLSRPRVLVWIPPTPMFWPGDDGIPTAPRPVDDTLIFPRQSQPITRNPRAPTNWGDPSQSR
jgi:hypothetical protein